MSDPYAVLGLARDADLAAIRQRYLDLVRQFPPDQAPERFAAIRSAYDEVRDPKRRLAVRLFELEGADSLEAIAADLRARLVAGRMTVAALLALAEEP
jgi:DnaJ-class molecular chaperone